MHYFNPALERMFKSNKTILAASEDHDDIVRWFESQNPTFKKRAKIVSNEDLGLNHLFRIDKVVQKFYYPRMPRSAYSNENQDVPRISMSSSLMGCMLGYGRWYYDAGLGTSKAQSKDNEGYKGGYIIQSLPFNYAIIPTKDDIWEVPYTDEVWLVNYNLSTSQYIPTIIGKMFIRSIKLTMNQGRAPDGNVTIYVEHDYDGLPFIRNKAYPAGYYKIETNYKSNKELRTGIDIVGNDINCYDEKQYTITAISKEEYLNEKRYTAHLLSMPPIPTCLKF